MIEPDLKQWLCAFQWPLRSKTFSACACSLQLCCIHSFPSNNQDQYHHDWHAWMLMPMLHIPIICMCSASHILQHSTLALCVKSTHQPAVWWIFGAQAIQYCRICPHLFRCDCTVMHMMFSQQQRQLPRQVFGQVVSGTQRIWLMIKHPGFHYHFPTCGWCVIHPNQIIPQPNIYTSRHSNTHIYVNIHYSHTAHLEPTDD